MGGFWDDRGAARRLLGAMLVAVYLIALLIAVMVLVARPARAEALTAATGYQTVYDVYAAEGAALPLALVFLYGKNGSHESPAMRAFARSFAAEGITVYLPSMPWSRKWNGTAEDAAAAVDALVAVAAQDGRKVVVGGQSMGAAFSLVWRPADAPPAVVGKLLTSPGHMLDMFPPTAQFWKGVMPSLNKAKALIAAGKGQEMARFEGTNTSGTNLLSENYEMRPVVYASFHDPEVFPSLRKALPQNKLPVYWGVGSRDPAGGGKRPSFDRLPPTPANVYSEIDGDHNSIMRDALPAMVTWVKGL
jgi:pimeloyl-ACP methyl ester carboxylesterase